MPDKPLISFVLIAYNQERFIREAVEGAFAQTYSPLEIVLSDDCSPDRTFDIMREMAAAYQGPHKIILNRNEQNLGICGHVNKVVDMSHGELIVPAAGDDVSLPERAGKALHYMEKCNWNKYVLSFNAAVIDEKGMTLCERHFVDSARESSQMHPLQRVIPVFHDNSDGSKCVDDGNLGASYVFQRKLFEIFGPLTNVVQEDSAIVFRAALLNGNVFVDDVLVRFRYHSNNTMTAKEKEFTDFANSKWALAFIQLRQNNRQDLESAYRKHLITKAIYKCISKSIEWQKWKPGVQLLVAKNRRMRAFLVGALNVHKSGMTLKRSIGWLLYACFPSVHNIIMPAPHTEEGGQNSQRVA